MSSSSCTKHVARRVVSLQLVPGFGGDDAPSQLFEALMPHR